MFGKFWYLEVKFFPRVFSKDSVLSVTNPSALVSTEIDTSVQWGRVE